MLKISLVDPMSCPSELNEWSGGKGRRFASHAGWSVVFALPLGGENGSGRSNKRARLEGENLALFLATNAFLDSALIRTPPSNPSWRTNSQAVHRDGPVRAPNQRPLLSVLVGVGDVVRALGRVWLDVHVFCRKLASARAPLPSIVVPSSSSESWF